MKTTSVLALAAASTVQMVAAHTEVWHLWVNDVDQGRGNQADGYIRYPPNNDPVKDVTSSDITCNVDGSTANTNTIEVAGGDDLTFEWHHNDDTSSDDIIASSHYGPVMVYIAPTDSAFTDASWVKLYESGYTGTYPDGTWAVTTLIANKGKHNITLPDLAAGDYLLRAEIIALHEAENSGGAQFYMECVQVKVTGSGSTSLPSGVAFPGAYAADDAGILFDIYNSFDSYPIPGPTVWDGTGSAAATTAAASAPASTTAAAATSVAASSKAAVTSAAASSQVAVAASSSKAVATSTAAAAPSSTGSSSSSTTLPESFTLDTFISWLESVAGSSAAKMLKSRMADARAHPRAF